MLLGSVFTSDLYFQPLVITSQELTYKLYSSFNPEFYALDHHLDTEKNGAWKLLICN